MTTTPHFVFDWSVCGQELSSHQKRVIRWVVALWIAERGGDYKDGYVHARIDPGEFPTTDRLFDA